MIINLVHTMRVNKHLIVGSPGVHIKAHLGFIDTDGFYPDRCELTIRDNRLCIVKTLEPVQLTEVQEYIADHHLADYEWLKERGFTKWSMGMFNNPHAEIDIGLRTIVKLQQTDSMLEIDLSDI